MVRLILLRGPAAVGKTTTAKNLAKRLNNVASIKEDYFRGMLQVKLGESNQTTYKNSAILIKTLIDKLLELDKWDDILIEGLFPDEEVLLSYFDYASERGFNIVLFQLEAHRDTLNNRNKIERGHVVRDSAIDDHLKLYEKLPKQAIVIKNEGTEEEVLDKIMKILDKN